MVLPGECHSVNFTLVSAGLLLPFLIFASIAHSSLLTYHYFRDLSPTACVRSPTLGQLPNFYPTFRLSGDPREGYIALFFEASPTCERNPPKGCCSLLRGRYPPEVPITARQAHPQSTAGRETDIQVANLRRNCHSPNIQSE